MRSKDSEIALAGSRRLRSTLAAAPVLFAHTAVTEIQISTLGYLSFGPMAQCVVHALKGLACRASPSRAR
jgi:hypothetical protein